MNSSSKFAHSHRRGQFIHIWENRSHVGNYGNIRPIAVSREWECSDQDMAGKPQQAAVVHWDAVTTIVGKGLLAS